MACSMIAESVDLGSAASERLSREIWFVRSRTFLRVISEFSTWRHSDQTLSAPPSVDEEGLAVAKVESIRRVDFRSDESDEIRFGYRKSLVHPAVLQR